MKKSEKAFTLIELLVVIGILSLLMAVLMGSLNGVMESARAAKCLTNMKNLALGCHNYMMSSQAFPYASSWEGTQRTGGGGVKFVGVKGWISWNSRNAYQRYASGYIEGESNSHKSNPSWHISTYERDPEIRNYCLTNGLLYKMVGSNRDVYRCPCHKKEKGLEPIWSYVMTYHNFYDVMDGSKEIETSSDAWNYPPNASANKSDRKLLFAELQYTELPGQTKPERDASPGNPKYDCVLNAILDDEPDGRFMNADDHGGESIGFNHKVGNMRVAHVVFCDGHTEKLQWPKKGLTEKQMKELTFWLCNAKDVTFNGRYYEKFDH